jgi:hypothetical protein
MACPHSWAATLTAAIDLSLKFPSESRITFLIGS